MWKKLFPDEYEVRRRRIWQLIRIIYGLLALLAVFSAIMSFIMPMPYLVGILLIAAVVGMVSTVYPIILIGMNIQHIRAEQDRERR